MTEKKMPLKTKNAKFMEYYNKVVDTEEYKKIKPHKRIKYLQSEFYKKTDIIIPLGTLYKLIKPINNSESENSDSTKIKEENKD
jgi:hypothetical protein